MTDILSIAAKAVRDASIHGRRNVLPLPGYTFTVTIDVEVWGDKLVGIVSNAYDHANAGDRSAAKRDAVEL